MSVTTLRVKGTDFVVIPRTEYARLKRLEASKIPALPRKLANGNYPAADASRVVMARTIIAMREKLKLSQAELARRAGIAVETLNRIERARVTPDTSTIAKLERILRPEA